METNSIFIKKVQQLAHIRLYIQIVTSENIKILEVLKLLFYAISFFHLCAI